MDPSPILSMVSPFFRDIHHAQIQHFQETVIGKEHCFGFCDLSQLSVKSPDGIHSIDQATDRFRVLEEAKRFTQLSFLDLAILKYFPLPFYPSDPVHPK